MTIHNVEYFNNILDKLGLKLYNNSYSGSKTKLSFIDTEGYLYYHSPSELQGKILYNYKLVKFHTKNPYTIQNIKLWLILSNKSFELVSDKYIKLKSVLTFKDKDGYYYTSNMDNLLYGKLPEQFAKSNPYTIQNIIIWLKLNNKNIELLSNKYKTASKDLKWKCLKEECREEFEMSWNEIISNVGCPYCSGHKAGLSNCLATKNPELASEWHSIKNGDLTPWDVTCGCNKRAWWICKECSHEWDVGINNRGCGEKSGCPECRTPKGEKRIKEIIKYLNILFDSQYTFDDLRGVGGGLLKYDVSTFHDKRKNKLWFLIEYDGIFHYEKQYDDDGFETLQIHDKLKNEYCESHNIPLLRIPYWEFDNIETILNNFISSLIQSLPEKEVISI